MPPVNTVPPVVSGSAILGQTLSTTTGTWTDANPLVYTYQWERCNSSGTSCVDIPGATNQTYVLTQADVGHTLRSRVTATESVAPPSGAQYGVPLNANGNANLQIGGTNGPNDRVAHRFRAQCSSTIQSVRWFCKIQDPTYSGGTHGTIVIDLYAVDGSGKPTGASLGRSQSLVNPSQGHPTTSLFPTQSWSSPPSVTNGTLYALVWTNLDGSPTVNFCSVNHPDLTITPRQPYAPDTDEAVMVSHNGGAWGSDHPSHTPEFLITYGNGQIQGNGYIDYRPSIAQTVGGSVQARLTATPSAGQTLNNIHVFVNKSGSPSALNYAVKQGGSTLRSGSIAAGTIASGYGWASQALSSPLTLTAGSSYTFEVSATTGSYQIIPFQQGTTQGWPAGGLIFGDGQGEYSTNGGSSWVPFGGGSHDIGLYFD